jgi:hypothetical protein
MVVASLLMLGSRFVLMRVMPLPEIGRTMAITNAAAVMSTVLVPLTLLLVMLLLRRRIAETVDP